MDEFIEKCRTCRTFLRHDDKLLPVTSIVEKNYQILDYFEKYLQINLSLDENFPQNICIKCFNKLLEVRTFYLQCYDSENYYRLKYQCPIKISNSILVFDQDNNVDGDTIASNPVIETKFEIIDENHKLNAIKTEVESLNEEYVLEDDLFVEDSQIKSNIEDNEESDESNENGNLKFYEIIEEYLTDDFSQDQEETKVKKNYACKICNEDFSTKRNYKTHMKRHSKKQWTISESSVCPECGKTFENKTKLQKHIYNHKKLHRVTCQICNKGFRAKYDLSLHMNIHTGEKPFKCNVCNKSFAAPSSLRTHKALHDGKKYDCPMCDTKLAEKGQLKRHLRMHTNERPYECSQCPNTYKQLSALKIHLAIHAGIKSEKCDQCSSSFVSKLHLYSHKFKVHKPKRFQCNECSKKFAAPFQMKSHLLTAHKISVEDLSSYDTKVKNEQLQSDI